MLASIISIGDELVLGQTLDTNSAWLSQRLAAVGVDISSHHCVGDSQADIARVIRETSNVVDAIIVTGGLGPTDDDLTRQALADVLETPLELNQPWLDHVKAYFEKLGRVMPEKNQIQAMIPAGAKMLWNNNGTAAGIHATIAHRFDRTRPPRQVDVFVMPGVPKEMKGMFDRDVFPHLQSRGGGAVILQKMLHTFGVGESTVAEQLGDLMHRGRNPRVGTTVSGGIVSLRIGARYDNLAAAESQMLDTVQRCHAALGDLIFGEDTQSLHGVVGEMLKQSGETVAVAESCTGGLLAKYLTDLPGSSSYFQGGWLVYSNEMKAQELGVDPKLIEQQGAVSEPVAEALAKAARQRAGTDYALAVSGIAGPDGGTATKPVGTVCIALSHSRGTDVRTFVFPGDREMVRDRSAKMALTLLRYRLAGKSLPF
jgi:nicotinamide-nucleotide amidase